MSTTINKITRRDMMKTTAATAAATAVSGLSITASSTAAPLPQPLPETGALGQRWSRTDGRLKVSGAARYAIEHVLENMTYGVVVQSTIPAGRIKQIDTAAASVAPGVLAIYTHENSLQIHPALVYMKGGAATEAFTPLQDNTVRWNGQHIALVVAESFEQATTAAALLHIEYELEKAVLNPTDAAAVPKVVEEAKFEWGDAHTALAKAVTRVEGEYTTPREYNVPMEPHACIAAWEKGSLTVWEPSQWVGGARRVISEWMELPIAKVRVISPYVGGGFGSKVAPHPHVALACAAARKLERPVKVVLTRSQTFTGYGGRPRTFQNLALGADKNGKLVSIVHRSWNETAMDDIHVEPCNAVTAMMYACPNVSSVHSIIPVHTVNPGWMRAPGENPSTYALETAMDELAYKVGLDPVELRLRNWAEQDPQAKIPWTTRRLREAYQAGADAFGWAKRNPEPRSMRSGRELIGWGMAAGTYPVRRTPGEARVIIHASGLVEVHSSGTDIGTGTYTILAQTVAEVLQVPVSQVTVLLGDTALPRAPLAGGSQLANLLTAAVHKTAVAACQQRLKTDTVLALAAI
jgi:xanthine dehydrogenase YagR molybdenum-binding subunit